MENNHRYQLESRRLTGRRQQKYNCPQCGRSKCLVRYVDTREGCTYVADAVGKCDHLHSCGYHYRPSDYFHDHPWLAADEGSAGGSLTLSAHPHNNRTDPLTAHRHSAVVPQEPPFQPLPMDYVVRSHSTASTFFQWMAGSLAPRLSIAPDILQSVYHDYLLGATRRAHVIFWQIDRRQQVHGGHIMQYRTNGSRDGYQGWTHIPLIRSGLLPADWTLHQSLFGEHLLDRRPEAHVCLVEGEKTAVAMAALQPDYLWLATAGCSGLTPRRVDCLRGRRVTVFPDSGCYDKWSQQMALTSGIDYNVYSGLETYPPNTDLCDLIF